MDQKIIRQLDELQKIVTIIASKMVTKDDLKHELANYLTKDDLKQSLANYPTKDDLKQELARHATKDDLKQELARHATKDDLKQELARHATKDDLKYFATKDDLKHFATKDDLLQMKSDLIEEIKESEGFIVSIVDKNKADKSDVDALKKRLTRIEKFAA